MPQRARREYVLESDEETSDGYTPIEVVEPRRRSRSRSRLAVRITDDHVAAPRYERPAQIYHHESYQQPYHPGYVGHPQVVAAPGLLGVPTTRPRASSTGGTPQPNFVPMYVAPPAARDSSRDRVRHRHHHHDHYSSSSSDDSDRRRRPRASRRQGDQGENLTAETVRRLAELEIRKQTELADREARRLSQYQSRRDEYSPGTAARLAELEAMKKRREREEEEALLMAKIEDRERREKEKKKQLLLQYEKEQEEAERAEQELAARVEAKRKKEEDRLKHERHQALLEERERIAKQKSDAKAERERILADEKVREEEAAAERRRIIAEEEDRKKEEKAKEDALRKRILAEEDERIAKEKKKERAKEEEFQREVRERFMRAGYSPDYVDDILEQKQLVHTGSRRTEENQLAITMDRPTFIRVQEKHLLPETLDYYRLPWEYDAVDRRYIIIKQYVSHQLQQELFRHTERVIRRRETRLITNGFTKDTVTTTTLTPKKDAMVMVRRKSEKQAKSPMGRNWMFT